MGGDVQVGGHGVVDYVVVFVSLVFMLWSIWYRRDLFLLLLPTMVTIDFFLPLASNVSPGRIAPMVIILWVAIAGGGQKHWRVPAPAQLLWLLLIACSTVISFSLLDGGLRSVVRGLFYFGLFAQWHFVANVCEDEHCFRFAFLGLGLAGLVHGAYALYQLVAFQLGLPFRGIARAWGADFAVVDGVLRVNGLASEPKRFSFIVLSGACAMLVLAARSNGPARWGSVLASVALVGLSLFSLSASYVVAACVTVCLCSLLSFRIAKAAIIVAALLVGFVLLVPEGASRFSDSLADILESRHQEVEVGLDGQRIYRQEFYAVEFLEDHPVMLIAGVGMGRYNDVLHGVYGAGVGRSGGVLLPMNSQLLEGVFDVGAFGVGVIYLFCFGLCFQLYGVVRSGVRADVCLGLFAIVVFLGVQSLLVQSWPLLFFAAGVATAYLRFAERAWFDGRGFLGFMDAEHAGAFGEEEGGGFDRSFS